MTPDQLRKLLAGGGADTTNPTQKQLDALWTILMALVVAAIFVIAGWVITSFATKSADYQQLAAMIAKQEATIDLLYQQCSIERGQPQPVQVIVPPSGSQPAPTGKSQ